MNRSLAALFGAAAVCSRFPGIRPDLCNPGELDPGMVEEYLRDFFATDPGPGNRVLRRLEVSCTASAYDLEELRGSALYHDFVVPHRLENTYWLATDLASGREHPEISVHLHPRDTERHEEVLLLLGLLLPAYRSGVEQQRRLARHRDELGSLLDRLEEALLVCAPDGRVLHQNRALQRRLADEPPADRARLEAALHRQAAAVGRLAGRGGEAELEGSGEGVVATARGSYRITAGFAAEEIFGPGPTVLVVLEPSRVLLAEERLRGRFALTQREIQVARLLARGSSNQEIAAELRVQPSTARRHTEHVLRKLGATSRAQVAALLLER